MTSRFLLIISLLTLLYCCPATAAATNQVWPATIRVGTIQNVQADHPALLLMQRAYHELGIEMELSHMAADRALLELKKGELIDATLGAILLFESLHPELVRVPVPIYQLELALFTADTSMQSADWQSLRSQPVIYVQGMQSVVFTLKQHQVKQTEAVLSLEQALKRLDMGRDRFAVLPKFEAEAMLKKLQLHQVRQLQPMLARMKLYHYVHHKHRALVAPLSQVLARLTGQAIEETKIGVNLQLNPQ